MAAWSILSSFAKRGCPGSAFCRKGPVKPSWKSTTHLYKVCPLCRWYSLPCRYSGMIPSHWRTLRSDRRRESPCTHQYLQFKKKNYKKRRKNWRKKTTTTTQTLLLRLALFRCFHDVCLCVCVGGETQLTNEKKSPSILESYSKCWRI